MFHPPPSHQARQPGGFSLIELLITVAIIGILVALVISSFSNATQDSRNVIVLQQQAVLQEALNSWIAHESSIARGTNTASLASAQATYNGASGALAKLALIAPYLDNGTYTQFTTNSSMANAINTDAMVKTQHYVTFSDWVTGSYPRVVLGP